MAILGLGPLLTLCLRSSVRHLTHLCTTLRPIMQDCPRRWNKRLWISEKTTYLSAIDIFNMSQQDAMGPQFWGVTPTSNVKICFFDMLLFSRGITALKSLVLARMSMEHTDPPSLVSRNKKRCLRETTAWWHVKAQYQKIIKQKYEQPCGYKEMKNIYSAAICTGQKWKKVLKT